MAASDTVRRGLPIWGLQLEKRKSQTGNSLLKRIGYTLTHLHGTVSADKTVTAKEWPRPRSVASVHDVFSILLFCEWVPRGQNSDSATFTQIGLFRWFLLILSVASHVATVLALYLGSVLWLKLDRTRRWVGHDTDKIHHLFLSWMSLLCGTHLLLLIVDQMVVLRNFDKRRTRKLSLNTHMGGLPKLLLGTLMIGAGVLVLADSRTFWKMHQTGSALCDIKYVGNVSLNGTLDQSGFVAICGKDSILTNTRTHGVSAVDQYNAWSKGRNYWRAMQFFNFFVALVHCLLTMTEDRRRGQNSVPDKKKLS